MQFKTCAIFITGKQEWKVNFHLAICHFSEDFPFQMSISLVIRFSSLVKSANVGTS